MSITISTNISSLNAQRNLSRSQNSLKTSMERLSSGLRVNSAKDDAAGLAISDRMTSQIRGLNQAARNANDGISLAQTAEGALQEHVSIIQRMRELAVQSATGTLTNSDRQSIESEFVQLKEEYNRIAFTTQFNGRNLLDGTFESQNFQIGANSGQGISISIPCMATRPCHVEPVVVPAPPPPPDPGVDGINVVFLLDTTGSMGTALIELRSEITNVINSLQTKTTNLKVGIVAYSDVYPGNTESFSLINMDDTGEAQLNSFLSVLAEGGGTEMLGQAIQEASAMPWDVGVNQLILVLGSAGDEANDPAVALQAAQDFKDSSPLSTVSTVSANGTSVFFQDLSTAGGGEYEVYVPGNLIDVIGDISDVIIVPPTPEPEPEPEPAAEPTFDTISLATADGAQEAISVLDNALIDVDDVRGVLGAFMNRMESTLANLQNISENLSAARSRILDADIAKETSEMTKQNILQQAGISILNQANQQPQLALSLLSDL